MGKWAIICLFVLGYHSINAQNCIPFLNESCQQESQKFKYQTNDASTAFQLQSSGFWEMPFELHENIDYRITVCSDEIFGGIILFVIIRNDGKELYNNSEHKFQSICEFSSVKNQQVFFQITAPQPSYGISDTIFAEGCIAIKIEEMHSIHTGF